MPHGKASRQLRVGDVVVIEANERDAAPACEACGFSLSGQHRLALGRSGTVVDVAGDTVSIEVLDAVLPWPATCLVKTNALPPRLHDRSLISQVKQRRGKSLKALQEELKGRPDMTARYSRACRTAAQNEKQRVQMMWAADAQYGNRF